MQIKINLKIFIFMILFFLTNQIKIYIIFMLFAFIHEIGHLIVGTIMGFTPNSIVINPFGLSIIFNSKIDYKKMKKFERKHS